MNCFEKYLVELLQGHITFDDKPVEVVRNFSNAPRLPVITLDLSAGVTTENYFRTYENQEVLYYRRSTTININSWCNTEEQRESVNKQIMDAYIDSINHHYKYCSNFISPLNYCTTTKNTCSAITGSGTRAQKNKCPDPEGLKYQCLSDKHNLCFGTIVIEPPLFLDEHDKHPPLLHSVFSSHADYVEPVSRQGQTSQGYEFNNEEED